VLWCPTPVRLSSPYHLQNHRHEIPPLYFQTVKAWFQWSVAGGSLALQSHDCRSGVAECVQLSVRVLKKHFKSCTCGWDDGAVCDIMFLSFATFLISDQSGQFVAPAFDIDDRFRTPYPEKVWNKNNPMSYKFLAQKIVWYVETIALMVFVCFLLCKLWHWKHIRPEYCEKAWAQEYQFRLDSHTRTWPYADGSYCCPHTA